MENLCDSANNGGEGTYDVLYFATPLGMPEVHLKENWRKSPSWYHTSWRTTPTSERGGRDWDGRATSSLAALTAATTSASVAKTESDVGKKSKMQQRYFHVTSDDLWCIRAKLAGKKSSLGKTYKTNQEANDKVNELNQQASKYVEIWHYCMLTLNGSARRRRRSRSNLTGTSTSP